MHCDQNHNRIIQVVINLLVAYTAQLKYWTVHEPKDPKFKPHASIQGFIFLGFMHSKNWAGFPLCISLFITYRVN